MEVGCPVFLRFNAGRKWKEATTGTEAFNPHGTQDICEFLEIVPVPAEKARALMGFSVRF